LFVTITSVLITLFSACLSSYIFARENKIVLKILYWLFLSALVIPGTILFLPLYVEINQMGLIGSYWGVILPNVAFGIPFAIFLMTDFIKSISPELFDSATIDGCSRFQAFYRIVLPLIKTPMQAVIAVQFINVWNDFILPLLILQNPDKQLVPFTLSSFITGLYSTDHGPQFAAIVISSIPCILIFTFMNRQFVNGFISGAVKE
jgi:raffinose/stachyose/melibiose transport system permease protein